MNLRSHFARHSSIALAAIIFLSSSTVYAQTVQSNQRPLNLLVVGDSILWGQGLKDEHKAWHQVKTWLEQNTGRQVHEKIEAHSGAVIGSAADPPGSTTVWLDGEINRAIPTVSEQINYALRSYSDPMQVDLVLVDGCINDLDARRLLNASSTVTTIRELTQAKCGPPVESMLERIASAFPKAQIIITGYYPIVSEKTSNDLFMRALNRRLYTPAPGTPRKSDKELRRQLIDLSKEWYRSSNERLAAAARTVDAKLSASGSRQRALFAEVEFLPDYAFGSHESRLWGFDASPLRKLLVILAFGRVSIRTNDEMRGQRSDTCEQVFKRPQGESKDQKKARQWRLLLCKVAALGHPNRKGSTMYAEAISRQLQSLLSAGWLSETRSIATPTP
jgi:lysophospholipase L1-like esterase